jgi:hypothetical protein
MAKRNKYILLVLIFIFFDHYLNSQKVDIIVSGEAKTETTILNNETFKINLNENDLKKFKSKGFISYGDVGAAGDGKSDDINFIIATHHIANKYGLAVRANIGAKYFIGGKGKSAIIKTNTNFLNSTFIIDDTNVENREASIFSVESNLNPISIYGVNRIKKNQDKININLKTSCLITVSDSNIRNYIRYGLNQNNGKPQTDIFIVDQNGKIDRSSPIIWDFNDITEISAIPIDAKQLIINGGKFITIANKAPSKYTYYSRNISITRSNVIVKNLEHTIIGEGDNGAPYRGFISISDCSNITVKGCVLTGHKTYRTIGNAGKPVSMGSYDLSVRRSINVSIINCKQTNDINDDTYWGLFASNYSKNITFDNCIFSRFDAHMGVYNATIRNSTLGYMGINAIGSGTLLIENTKVYGRSLVNFRQDYGSTWDGELFIKNCVFAPKRSNAECLAIFNGRNFGKHDFGYTCKMPKNIIIDNLFFDDSDFNEEKKSLVIFSNFNPEMKSDNYVESYPYIKTKKVIINNLTTSSGKELLVSENPYMFKGVKIKKK